MAGPDKFHLMVGASDHTAVGAVCSALAKSQSVKKFVFANTCSPYRYEGLREDLVDRSVWWPWLAFALFSGSATHAIKSVTLQVGGLRLAHVDTMRQVLEHPNPIAFVCALDRADDAGAAVELDSVVGLSSQTWVTIRPRLAIGTDRDSNNPPRKVMVSLGRLFDIVRDDLNENSFEVVLPGHGVVSANRVDATRHVLRRPRRPNAITRLHLLLAEDESIPAVIELLRLIGAPLKHLQLTRWSTTLTDEFLGNVCTLCPNLKSLCVDGPLESLRWLYSPIDTSGLRCELRSLLLKGLVASTGSFDELLVILGDLTHPVTKSLRELHYEPISLTEEDPVPTHSESIDSWFTMLCKNPWLERCEFMWACHDHPDKELQEKLRHQNGKRLLLPEMLAFLSVVTSRRTTGFSDLHESEQTSARYQLVETNIEHILELAGVPLRRVCC